MARVARWGAPVTYVAAVLLIGFTLIGILARSPDTRANFQDAPEGYDRTELSSIGAEDEFEGLNPLLGDSPQANYVGAGCASCHGLSGEGAVVGPDIWGKNFEDMLEVVRDGEHGMPVYGPDRLTDAQIEALTNYLNELKATQGSPAPASRAR